MVRASLESQVGFVTAGNCGVFIRRKLDELVMSLLAFHNELSTQNWSGQGESDSLIKTKHCDGLKR